MKIVHAAMLAALIVPVSLPARAEKLDLSTMTCKQFVAGSKEEIGTILTWLDRLLQGRG